MLVRDLSLPPGWRFTKTTARLYLQEPLRDIDKQRRSWCVERLVVASEGRPGCWNAVLTDEKLKSKTAYRLRRGAEHRPFPPL